jgi:uncharacterized protein
MPADGLTFRHQYAAGELDTGEYGFGLKDPPLVTGRANRVGMDLRLRGEIKTALCAPCDRCLIDVVFPIEIPFDLLYSPGDPGAGHAGEHELHERDLDFGVYENDEIELDELVLEQLELFLPSRVLCKDECRGLCPQCGADLNLEQCDCRPEVDSRWQVLADLKADIEKD